jgi:hypothetical protein
MAKKPEPPKPTSWNIYKQKPSGLAPSRRRTKPPIETATPDFNGARYRLMAVKR